MAELSAEVFQVVSQIMRYWFAALGILIVLRTYRMLRQERKARHRRVRNLPEAGMIGQWLVLKGSQELPEETLVSVPWEGILGDRRLSDVYIPVEGVAHSHLWFAFNAKRGLRLRPAFRQSCLVNGEPLTWRGARRKPVYIHHGDVLTVGEAVLKLRVYFGLERELRPVVAEDAPLPEAPGDTALPGAEDMPPIQNPAEGGEG